MVKIATTELKGRQLDWAVAKVKGWLEIPNNPVTRPESYTLRPSSDNGVGGSILDQYDISVWLTFDGLSSKGKWSAAMPDWFDEDDPTKPTDPEAAYGDTRREAGMRALVRHELGDEVDIPEELT